MKIVLSVLPKWRTDGVGWRGGPRPVDLPDRGGEGPGNRGPARLTEGEIVGGDWGLFFLYRSRARHDFRPCRVSIRPVVTIRHGR
jgi:hypothetical protein